MNLTQLKVYIKGFADGLREGQAPKNEQWQELLKVVEAAQDDLVDLTSGCKCGENCPCKNPTIPPTTPYVEPLREPYWTTHTDGTAPCDVEPNYNEINDRFGQR